MLDERGQADLRVNQGVLALSGYGLRLAVNRGHLVAADGICDGRRSGRLARATAGLKRVVLLGHTGFITLEALRWLRDVGVPFVQIDADGVVIAAWGPIGLDDSRLRRAQALAPGNGVGLKIARELVRRKLEGQLALLARMPDGQASVAVIHENLGSLERTLSPVQLRLFESVAAAAYWKAWERVPIRFVRRDESRLPDHWRTFGPRGSPLANGPRLAANPPNAILNYLYAILEGEARIGALTMGLDPGLGVIHADQPARDSLALDLIEPVRPEVDAYALELLRTRVFRACDFFETRQGVCRILPPLARELAATATQWAQRVGPVAEWAAEMFAAAPGSRIHKIPTLLTQNRRSAGRNGLYRNPLKQLQPLKPMPAGICHSCGVVLASRRRSYCDDCLGARKAEGLAAFRRAGFTSLSKLIAQGRDPAHGGEAKLKRSKTVSRRHKEAVEWDERHPRPGPSEFIRTILPGIQAVSIQRIVKATGLSPRYCALIRRGLRVPHPRYWRQFKQLANRTEVQATEMPG